MQSLKIEQIVDVDRYPVHRPGDERYTRLMQEGRQALRESALFSMPGFVRSEIVSHMAQELDGLFAASCRYDRPRHAYDYEFDETDYAADHPRRQFHPCAYNQVLNYQIPNDSLLRQVYYWQPLTDFLGLLCDYDSFYRSDCPHLALTSKIAGAGDTDGWHYDTNDVVFSILLQAPEAGGEFEYAPYIRSESDENYDAVAKLWQAPDSLALRPPMAPGNLTVFKGDLSMHRVTPVIGERKRIVALFCYDRNPGTTFDQGYINELSQGMPSA